MVRQKRVWGKAHCIVIKQMMSLLSLLNVVCDFETLRVSVVNLTHLGG